MLSRIKSFGFHKNYTRYEKKCLGKIVYFKGIYKFTSEHFLIGQGFFVLIVKKKRY